MFLISINVTNDFIPYIVYMHVCVCIYIYIYINFQFELNEKYHQRKPRAIINEEYLSRPENKNDICGCYT